MSDIIIRKTGGDACATPENVAKTLHIIRSYKGLQCIVPSASGHLTNRELRTTSLLRQWHQVGQARLSNACREIRALVENHHLAIVRHNNITIDLSDEFETIAEMIDRGASLAYAEHCGELLIGQILAAGTGFRLVDPATFLCVDEHRRYREEHSSVAQALAGGSSVSPGYYGHNLAGEIQLLPENGTDISAAIIAKELRAKRYENWKRVIGITVADPRIIPDSPTIDMLTFKEMHQLSTNGTQAIHPKAVQIAEEGGVPINVRSYEHPDEQGTLIVPNDTEFEHKGIVTAISGRTDCTDFYIEKPGIDEEIGFYRDVFGVFADNGVSIARVMDDDDSIGVIVENGHLGKKEERDEMLRALAKNIEMRCETKPVIHSDISIIGTIGRKMAGTRRVLERIARAVADANINIEVAGQNKAQTNVMVGVTQARHDDAIRAIYREFMG